MRRTQTGALLVAGFVLAGSLRGQDWRGKARVDGWIRDKGGKAIAGATVSLSRPKGGGPTVTSNEKGYWAVLGLSGGTWNLDVSAKGFETRKVTVSLSEASRIPPMEILLEPTAGPVAAAGATAPNQAAVEVKAAIEEGNRLLLEKKYPEARAQYERALALVPDTPAILKGIAQTWHGENNRGKAIEALRQVEVLDPADLDNRVLVASILLEDGRIDEGQKSLDALPPGAVRDPAVYVNVGILFMNRSNPAQAQIYFTKAIELDPSQADAYYYRGLTLMKAKKNAEARADFKKYLELAPQGNESREVRDILQTLK